MRMYSYIFIILGTHHTRPDRRLSIYTVVLYVHFLGSVNFILYIYIMIAVGVFWFCWKSRVILEIEETRRKLSDERIIIAVRTKVLRYNYFDDIVSARGTSCSTGPKVLLNRAERGDDFVPTAALYTSNEPLRKPFYAVITIRRRTACVVQLNRNRSVDRNNNAVALLQDARISVSGGSYGLPVFFRFSGLEHLGSP